MGGAVSASMLDSVGVQWALAGHSERRVIFEESDEYINGQCLKLISQGMSVMLCIGESEAEYEQDLAGSVCAVQLKKGLAGISKDDMKNVAIAYEPVWDIETANSVRILYGGSVTPDSVDSLMAKPDIDGALVGGASLDSEKFGRIINFQV